EKPNKTRWTVSRSGFYCLFPKTFRGQRLQRSSKLGYADLELHDAQLQPHVLGLLDPYQAVQVRTRNFLHDRNIKWGSIVSDVFGKSGLAILRLLASGQTDAGKLTLAVTTKIKRIDEARKALTNCFTKEHCFLISELMDQYDHLQKKLVAID